MKSSTRSSRRRFAPALIAALCLSAATSPARADTVLDWNATAAALSIPAPPILARVMATMHGAVHDATTVARTGNPTTPRCPWRGSRWC